MSFYSSFKAWLKYHLCEAFPYRLLCSLLLPSSYVAGPIPLYNPPFFISLSKQGAPWGHCQFWSCSESPVQYLTKRKHSIAVCWMWINGQEGAGLWHWNTLILPTSFFLEGQTLKNYSSTEKLMPVLFLGVEIPFVFSCFLAWLWLLAASLSWLWHLSPCQDIYSLPTAGSSWWAGLLHSPVQAGTDHLWWFGCPC